MPLHLFMLALPPLDHGTQEHTLFKWFHKNYVFYKPCSTVHTHLTVIMAQEEEGIGPGLGPGSKEAGARVQAAAPHHYGVDLGFQSSPLCHQQFPLISLHSLGMRVEEIECK